MKHVQSGECMTVDQQNPAGKFLIGRNNHNEDLSIKSFLFYF